MNQDLAPTGALLVLLGRAAISLSPHPTDPHLIRWFPAEAPKGLLRHLLAEKSAILVMLGQPLCFATDAARDVFEERIGIATSLEMDCNVGSPAWLIAVGEALELDAARINQALPTIET
ncbi:MAG: hypothetical protein ACOYN0_18530 [Phycisphaerales bacterium]